MMSIKCAIPLFVLAVVMFGAINATEHQGLQMFESIYRDTVNIGSDSRTEPASRDDHVCYPDIGCFDHHGPMKHTEILPYSPEKIGTKFYAYTAANPEQEHVVDAHSVSSFNVIDAKRRLVVLSHGFGNSYTTPQLVAIKNSLLKYTDGEVATVIMVDWKKGAAQPMYLEASTNTQVVGRQIAFLVNELKLKHGVNPANVYLIGFSLGAQVSGFAGKYSQSQFKWKFGRITGLDAAAPLFEGFPGAFLTKDDAQFVDAIHTSVGHNLLKGEIGFIMDYAHVDFFPNGGHNQPMCHSLFHIACNHYASVQFYEASLSAKKSCQFKGFNCVDYKSFTEHKCTKSDDNMGYYADHYQSRGARFLSTSAEYPYCK